MLASDSLYVQLAEPIEILKKWDYYCAENSVATTLAIEWAEKLTVSAQAFLDAESNASLPPRPDACTGGLFACALRNDTS